jgi:alpha-beta hydrolase superfamily lysophospholipase
MSPFFRSTAFLAVAFALAACVNSDHYVFRPSRQVEPTPAAVGLAFRDLELFTADGVAIRAWHIPARPGRPTVVYFHGNSGTMSGRVELLAGLVRELDVGILSFDYRGYGGSGGAPTGESDLSADTRAVLDYADREGIARSDLIYYGFSLGAAVAARAAVERPPAGVLLESPFTTLNDIAWRVSACAWTCLGRWSVKSRFDNLEAVSRITVPLLLVHGGRDRLAPPSMSGKLFAAARPPKQLLLVPGAGHNDASSKDPLLYLEAWRWLLAESGFSPGR